VGKKTEVGPGLEQHPPEVPLTPEEQALVEAQQALAEDLGGVVTIQMPEGTGLVPLGPDELAFIDRLGFARQQRAEQIATFETIAARRRQDIDAWLSLVTRSLRAQVQYLDMVLRIQFPGKAKSLPLPSVTLARKAQPSRITITDPAALLAFAKANKLPVKTAESVAHADVVEYYEATGEVPPGCEYVESTDNPHVKF
jgi:hypothetical protein